MSMSYAVIYDGNCNLCVSFVRLLSNFDRGKLFSYVPMQDEENLRQLNVTSADCEMGMILIDLTEPTHRWQGSDAAEEIVRLLPLGKALVGAYRAMSPLKNLGDSVYIQVRDTRYELFGKRDRTYYTAYPFGCAVKKQDRNEP